MHMGIERNVSKPKGKIYSESRKNRRRQKKPTMVQKLYDTCKEVFADCGPGVVPSPDKVERLKAILDTMTEIDVGLRPDMPFFKASTAGKFPRITYQHIYECDKFSIGIFCLPPNGVIPLHNHPEMTVFSKLLFGTMHIKSYDWVKDGSTGTPLLADPLDGQSGCVRLAKVKVDSEFTAPCNTSILYPADGGNMHCFTARTSCAVLDVLGPPYCDPEGRHCQYYLESPLAKYTGMDQCIVS
ncbi:OLC1v1009499C4 [Oldenlandia corymbosa var. corymbosa]|uniref:cysteine dioxygenase n=1 Tax=Oldenlandia corymbosa var. corymbosa TaxID=529605 RepID=A0AAV1DSA5_OLDCO|nr:OLC1v1009499C4 [Oldenlandia corymbosa var. corymbosa]